MNNTTNKIVQSMHDALWAIANMQVQEHTNKDEVLALCMSIAWIELEKCRRLAQEDTEANKQTTMVNNKINQRMNKKMTIQEMIAQSMYDALRVIANMQVQEHTDKGKLLTLCMSIAKLELEKCRMMMMAQEDS